MTEFEKMIRLLDMAWYLRGEIVPCLVGPPGIGKTAAVRQHAKAHGCGKVVKIVASRCVPSETVGMTMPDDEHRTMTIYNSMQLGSLEDGDILFLDELLEADQYVLSTMLTLIESREMADGTPLPDVQIIAATNDTIPPEQLKLNIRQRFMFQRFGIDMDGTRQYILERTGMRLGLDLLNQLRDNGSDYNILTPRSLVKLCLWVDSVPADRLVQVAKIINNIWGSNIGDNIAKARHQRDASKPSPEDQVRTEVINMMARGEIEVRSEIDAERFSDCSMQELLEMLQGLDDWEKISQHLASLTIEESEEVDDQTDVTF